ncbi:MAG: S-adenosylmethionine:tRNA ribosyltransferase-isomerase, partial [Bacteroidia bacterium]|nr:S-adenosylmethionine:tRNA ribosyltransferase-isomerase [Bacteroidia bacterium]
MHNPADISILDYTYNLPQEKIAQYPLANRDQSKLLVFQNGQISEDRFREISKYLSSDTTLVFNTTRVVNARLHFLSAKKQDIEIFCLGPDDGSQDPSQQMLKKSSVQWRCFVGNLKRWKDDVLTCEKSGVSLHAEIRGRQN